MALICVQCMMKALLEGREPPRFNETVEEHLRRAHPNPLTTQQERAELEDQLAARIDPTRN